MDGERSSWVALAGAMSLVAIPARAQPAGEVPPPESLETPYEDVPPASRQTPPPASAAPAPVQAAPVPAPAAPIAHAPDTRPPGPIRAQRRLVLTGEIGWNGLAGFGPVLTYHAHPHFSMDLGAGVSLLGWKVGLRARYNFLTSPATPFVGIGVNAATGLGEVTLDPKDDPNGDPNRDPVTADLTDSYLIQGVVGIDFIHRRGFTLVGCLGYAKLLNDNNVKILAGSLTKDEQRGFDIAFRSGPVLSIALGYAFE